MLLTDRSAHNDEDKNEIDADGGGAHDAPVAARAHVPETSAPWTRAAHLDLSERADIFVEASVPARAREALDPWVISVASFADWQ